MANNRALGALLWLADAWRRRATKEQMSLQRPLAAIAGAIFVSVVIAYALDLVFPPNLERYQDLSVEVRARDGRLLRGFLSADDKWRLKTKIDDVDPIYLAYLKAYEDKRFDRHGGVDPWAVFRAVWQTVSTGRVVSGASTLTMQTARLLEPRPRGLRTKVLQSARAIQLEWHYSKSEILGFYLTLAPFGGNIEGVRAASLAYFGKEPGVLTPAEAALLVSLPQSPERLRPDRHGPRARAGRDKVLARLLDAHIISLQTSKEAATVPVPEHRSLFPFFAPRFTQTHKRYAAPGRPEIRTTLDMDLQIALEAMMASESTWFPDRASMAIVVGDNETRSVIAYGGGLDFWGSFGQIDLARAIRSPGSTLKPFIYGLAFDELALHPETAMLDAPMDFGGYEPENFSKTFQGTVSVREALQLSLNVPAVAVLDRLGPERFWGALRGAGAELKLKHASARPSLPLALGGAGVSLLDLTGLYSALSTGGEAVPLRTRLDQPARRPVRLLSARSAFYVTDILQGSPLPAGWSFGGEVKRDRPIAFKTGTSYGFRDAWAIGVSPRYTVGVWLGRPDGSARAGQYGRAVAAPILLKAFDLLPGENGATWTRPNDVLVATSSGALPNPLRQFVARPTSAAGIGASASGPQIAFPPNGAVLELGNEEDDRLLELRGIGGTEPYRWMVEGELLPGAGFWAPTHWQVTEPGFVRMVLIDANGRTDRAQIRVTFENSGDRAPTYPK